MEVIQQTAAVILAALEPPSEEEEEEIASTETRNSRRWRHENHPCILHKAGGWRPNLYVRIENPPYLPLVVEAVDESGPLGLPALSVAHYSEQNPRAGFPISNPGSVSASAMASIEIRS